MVQRFTDKQVSPALEDAAAQMRAQGLQVQTLLGKSGNMGVRVEMEEGNPFRLRSEPGRLSGDPDRIGPSPMRRASVITVPGVPAQQAAQDYDLMGFTQDQICSVLDQLKAISGSLAGCIAKP